MKNLFFTILTFCLSFQSSSQTVAINQQINLLYSHKIDSIFLLDQKVRSTKFLRHGRRYQRLLKTDFISLNKRNLKKLNDSKKLVDIWNSTDKSNTSTLLNLIDKHGFPSIQKIGHNSHLNAFIILLHFDHDPNNLILGKTLKNALNNEELTPTQYAQIIDRHLISGGNQPTFYEWGWCSYFDLSDEQKKVVKEHRNRIGLKSKSVKCSTFGKAKIID